MSSALLSFTRLDYPEVDPPGWAKLVTVQVEDGRPVAGELPLDYHLCPPFAPTYEENYRLHSGLDAECSGGGERP